MIRKERAAGDVQVQTRASDDPRELMCPSAPAHLPGAVVFGVVDHGAEKAEVMYLQEPIPVTEEILQLAAPLEPREVFRIGAACQTSLCAHWSGSECALVTDIVRLVPASALTAPPCKLRPQCRWYAQAGRRACMRCPEVVSNDHQPSEEMRAASNPSRPKAGAHGA